MVIKTFCNGSFQCPVSSNPNGVGKPGRTFRVGTKIGGFMIPVVFITYLDHPKGFMWTFPKHVVARPIIGDLVQAADGTVLKICQICHCVGADNTPFDDDSPYLRIVLTSNNL